jgi:hypothetical protein
MVGSRYPPARRAPLTHRPAAARAPRTTPGCTCGHARVQGANSLPAVRVRGRRAVVTDVGVRPPNDGQAAADDARPPAHDRQKTLPQRRCTSCV